MTSSIHARPAGYRSTRACTVACLSSTDERIAALADSASAHARTRSSTESSHRSSNRTSASTNTTDTTQTTLSLIHI